MHETFRLRRSVGTPLLPITITIFLALVPLYAVSQSHEEEVVRNAYAKFSLMCSLPPLVEAAIDQIGSNKQIAPDTLAARMAQATPVFTLTDFRVGNISDIANDPWSDFIDDPHKGDTVLDGSIINQGYGYNGIGTTWEMANVSWRTDQSDRNPEAVKLIMSQPVSEIIKLGSHQWEDNQADAKPPITYTRYAAFMVTATFQGKTVGPHKAIFLFGHDAKGKEYVTANDLYSGQNPLGVEVNRHVKLDGLLLGKIREAPVVADWLRTNVMPASSCSSTDTHVMCCEHGKCGISPVTYNRELSVPLPPKAQ